MVKSLAQQLLSATTLPSGMALTWPLLLVSISLADILVLVVCGIALPGKKKGAVRKEKAQSPTLPTNVNSGPNRWSR